MPDPSSTRAFVLSFLRPHRLRIALLFMTALAMASLGAVEPLLYKGLFDPLLGHGAKSRALVFLAALVVTLLTREVLTAALDWLVWKMRIAVNFELLRETVDRLHALPLSHHRDQSVGAVMTKVERGISGTLSAFSEVAFHLVPSIVYLLVSAAVMVELDVRLSLVVIMLAPLPALIGARASKEQMTRERDLMKRWTRLFARLNEVLSGIAVVKSFVKEEDEKRRFVSGVAAANEIVVQGVATDARTTLAKNAVMALARIAAIALGGWLVMANEITMGTLIAFLGYVSGVFLPVQALTGMYQTICKGAVSAEAVASILRAEDELGDAPDAVELDSLRGDVKFENIVFEYREGAPILHGVNLEVRAGDTVALVGASGAGKTSLMALLQRLYDPTKGRVLLDGRDIRSIKQRSLRKKIGVVLQEGMLFDDTIRDNILFGDAAASPADVVAAARAANAHDFIVRMPQGYETMIGERGCKLSGGERQRIAIARALLKDAPILILDEATSALDAESEDLVRGAIERAAKGRTTFIIAHRLATVTHADRIVVFDSGRICEVGSHDELLRKNGHYADLVRRQTRGLIGA